MSSAEADVLPFPAGAEPVTLRDARPERTRYRDSRVILGGGDGPVSPREVSPAAPPIVVPPVLVSTSGEPLNSLTWDQYLSWRRTKCRPYDHERGPALTVAPAADSITPSSSASRVRDRALEEIDQAILELIGEVAELGELFLANGPFTFWGERRTKLIDECGDILFCACWSLDAWGLNPLKGADDLELFRVTDGHLLARFAEAIASHAPEDIVSDVRFSADLKSLILHTLVVAQANAGLLANSYKKLRYQRRQQSVEQQVGRICEVLVAVNQLLIVANSNVEEALKFNMRKLDARYPDGYKPGQGGGVRTGEGK